MTTGATTAATPTATPRFKVNTGEDSDCPDELWDSSDRDSDGFISWDEFDDLKGEGIL